MASTRRTDSPTRPSASLRAGALTSGSLLSRSRRLARAPCAAFGGTLESGWWFGVAPSGDSSAGRQPHRVEDLRVPRTAAQVAAQRLADLVVRGLRYPPQEIHRRHDQPRRAEATLHRPRRGERLLH